MTNTTYTPTLADVLALYRSGRPGCETEATEVACRFGHTRSFVAHLAADGRCTMHADLDSRSARCPEPATATRALHGEVLPVCDRHDFGGGIVYREGAGR